LFSLIKADFEFAKQFLPEAPSNEREVVMRFFQAYDELDAAKSQAFYNASIAANESAAERDFTNLQSFAKRIGLPIETPPPLVEKRKAAAAALTERLRKEREARETKQAVSTGITLFVFCSIIGVVLFGISSCWNSFTSQSYSPPPQANSQADSSCDVTDLAKASILDAQRGDYVDGYAEANRAIQKAKACANGMPWDHYNQIESAAMGMGLAGRAINERHLPQGDSATDWKMADIYLLRCANPQTDSESNDLAAACEHTLEGVNEVMHGR
jgi:hypothetical protein